MYCPKTCTNYPTNFCCQLSSSSDTNKKDGAQLQRSSDGWPSSLYLHLWLVIPSWWNFLTWGLIIKLCAKAWLQTGQLNGRSFRWTASTCLFRCAGLVEVLWQYEHVLVTDLGWITNSRGWVTPTELLWGWVTKLLRGSVWLHGWVRGV